MTQTNNYLTKIVKLPLNILKSIWNGAKLSADIRATRGELSKLNDAELRDIGITRGDIEAIARGDGDLLRSAVRNKFYLPDAPISYVNPNLKGWS